MMVMVAGVGGRREMDGKVWQLGRGGQQRGQQRQLACRVADVNTDDAMHAAVPPMWVTAMHENVSKRGGDTG